MKNCLRKIIVVLICLLPLSIAAQTVKESKGESNKGAVSAGVQRQAAKEKWKKQRREDRAQKKAIKEHDKRLQTKKTRKQMREERRKSDKLRANKREPFLIRLFKYKH